MDRACQIARNYLSENGTFHKHINEAIKKSTARIKQLYKFAGTLKSHTLYKVYRSAIEPIVLYGTEVLYENLTCSTLKKLITMELAAIKITHQLQKRTPTIDCLNHIHKGGIVDRIDSRRASFILKNADSPLIRQGETSVYSSGRRIRTKRLHKDRHVHKAGWKTPLKLHKPHIFFSDIGQAADLAPEDHSISQLMHPEAFPVAAAGSANTPSTAGAGCSQKNLFPIIRRFNIKPA